jgi:hypothetical protein
MAVKLAGGGFYREYGVDSKQSACGRPCERGAVYHDGLGADGEKACFDENIGECSIIMRACLWSLSRKAARGTTTCLLLTKERIMETA